MKKLMIALSAAALAFGLRADVEVTVLNGTSFEGSQEGAVTAQNPIVDDAGVTWDTTDEAATLNITAYGDDKYGYSKPDNARLENKFDAQDKYLNLKTAFGKPLTRTIDIPMASDTDAGVYFDSLVKFTACDEAPDAGSYTNAKIIVWALEDDAGNATLNVSAVGGNFNVGTIDCSAWHRLTIKSFSRVNTSGRAVGGFAIFVDGVAKMCQDEDYESRSTIAGIEADLTNNAKEFFKADNLYLALGNGSDDYQKIKSVGFDGQGCIDDVAFTATSPITAAADVQFCEIKLGTGVASFKYQEETYQATATVRKPEGKITVTGVTCQAGYFGNDEQELTADKEGNFTVVAQKKAVSINGVNYASFGEALDVALKAGTIAGATLKLESSILLTETALIADASTNVVIDLNGLSITGATGKCVFSVTNSNFLVKDSSNGKTGKVVVVQGTGDSVFAINLVGESLDDWKVSIEGGTFEGGRDDGELNLGYGSDLPVAITGGWFQHDPSGYVYGDYAATVDASHDNYYKVAYLENGSEDHPWLIGSVADIESKLIVNASKGHYFKQTQDIALTNDFPGVGVNNAKDLVSWKIGTANDEITEEKAIANTNVFIQGAFNGVFDGDGKTISGLELTRNDYAGFFNSAYGATIKNMKIALTAKNGWAAARGGSYDSAYGGGVILGVSIDSTVENCEVIKTDVSTEFAGPKGMGAIVGYAGSGTTIKGCVNNVKVTSANEKVAGLIACAQNGCEYLGKKGVVVEDCTNNGDVVCTTADKYRASGLVSYGDCKVTFKGANVFAGKLIQAGNNPTVQSIINFGGSGTVVLENAAFTVPAAYKTVNEKAVDGLWFATVADGVATLIKNEAVVKDGSYKVMAPSAPAITLAEIGDKITIDTSLAPVTVDTSATDAYVAQEGNVYTVTEKTTPTITVTLAEPITEYKSGLAFPTPTVEGATTYTTNWNPNAISEPAAGTTNEYVVTINVAATKTTKATSGSATWKVFKAVASAPEVVPGQPVHYDSEPSKEDLAKVTVALDDSQKGLTADQQAAYKACFKPVATQATGGGWEVTMVPTETTVAAVDTAVKAVETTILATPGAAVETNITTIPGLYYSVATGTTLTLTEGKRTMATGTTLPVTIPAVGTTQGFYQIRVNVTSGKVGGE